MPEIGKEFPAINSVQRNEQRVEYAKKKDFKVDEPSAIPTGIHSKRTIPSDEQQLEKASRQFEALLLQQMLKSMWDTVPEASLTGGGSDVSLYRDMFNEALAESISKGQGIGIKDIVGRDLKRIGESK